MSDTDMMQLYSKRILALASDIAHAGKLEDPQASAMKRSPQCGSSVTAHVVMEDGRVAQFGQEVRACALGQASASVLGAGVVGATRAQIQRGADQLQAMLKENGPAPDAPWTGLEALSAARDYPNRHPSIMLSWLATLEAIDAADQST